MDIQDNFSKLMKDFRLEREWTLQQMANACRVDVRTIWNIENGKVTPHELTVHKIKKALPSLFEPKRGRVGI